MPDIRTPRERLTDLTQEIAADERERTRRWAEQAANVGVGVTPGMTIDDLVPEDICDFIPDMSILDQEVNPKQLAATRDQKPALHLLEHVADVQIAGALEHGATKYGRRNFRETPIRANMYVGAIRRHIGAWADGEDVDPDSGLSHLAHIGANIHVLFGAIAAGTFVDDRGPESQSEVQARLSTASNRSRT